MERFGNKMKLFSQTGYNLAVRADGSVVGVQDDDDYDSCLEITTVGVGLVRIRSIENGTFICFNEHGKLYGEQMPEHEGTVFHEAFQGSYNAYKSLKYPDWFIGLKRNGKSKKGPNTGHGQKAVRFLPRRLE